MQEVCDQYLIMWQKDLIRQRPEMTAEDRTKFVKDRRADEQDVQGFRAMFVSKDDIEVHRSARAFHT